MANSLAQADLHIHTIFSDSTLSALEVVEESMRAKLACIAITDHDTVDGVEPVRQAAKGFDLEVISGVELSSEVQGKDVHVLGYFVDGTNPSFREHLSKMKEIRLERLKEMIEKFNTLGKGVLSWEDVKPFILGSSAGRPHLAMAMKEKGIVKSIPEAFERFLGENGPAYVRKSNITPYDAIKLIEDAGGISALAHPMVTNKDELIPSFVKAGLKGLEVYYPNYSDAAIQYYEGIARKNKLLITGGSDAHGKAKSYTYIGKISISYDLVEEMKKALPANKK